MNCFLQAWGLLTVELPSSREELEVRLGVLLEPQNVLLNICSHTNVQPPPMSSDTLLQSLGWYHSRNIFAKPW